MPMLPVPAFVAAILGYLALRVLASGGRPLLAAFLAAVAGQSLLVALVGGYAVEALRPILPVCAAIVPPMAWITFRDALVRRPAIRDAAPHAAGPAFVLFARVFAPETVDVAVPAIFLGYGAAILMTLRGRPDMRLAALGAGAVPVAIWRALGWALIASAASDAVIAAAYATGNPRWAGWVVTMASSMALLALGLLSTQPGASGPADEDEPPRAPRLPDAAEALEDDAILARLDAFLARERAHLDPNLTLARLARRMHVPEKRLSAAINRATGGNVSRHLNGWRIRHACGLIAAGASATDAMLRSGFNTKSNFNREFRRVTGSTPSRWRGGRAPAADGVGRLATVEVD